MLPARLSTIAVVLGAMILPDFTALAGEAGESSCPQLCDGWSVSLSGGPGFILYGNAWFDSVRSSKLYPMADLRVGRVLGPGSRSIFPKEYNYPTVGLGVSFNNLRAIHCTDPTHLDNMVDLYGFFERNIIRRPHFSFGYDLIIGLGFTSTKYDPFTNPKNELISSPVVFDLGTGLFVKYDLTSHFGIGASLHFRHHSAGKLAFPNCGVNEVLPTVSARYRLCNAAQPERQNHEQDGEHEEVAGLGELALKVSVGGGINRCLTSWTVLNEMVEDPAQKALTIDAFPKEFASFDLSYRYAPRFSSGLGLDLFCASGDYVDAMRKYEAVIVGSENVATHTYSPFSCGISASQYFHYGDFAIHIGIGIYLWHRTGILEDAGISYERIGMSYSFPRLAGLTLSMNCKCHYFSSAEMMEFGIGIPVKSWKLKISD